MKEYAHALLAARAPGKANHQYVTNVASVVYHISLVPFNTIEESL